MKPKRLLLLSEGFGAGHTQAAHALAAGLSRLWPGIDTPVVELGASLHPTVSRLIFSAYRKTVLSSPKLYGYIYRSQYDKSLNRVLQLALHRIFYSQAARLLERMKPDAVVCTHPFPNIVIARLKRSGLDIPLCTVITDYDAHGTWLNPEVDLYLAPTAPVKRKLLRHGVPAHRVSVTGIPVHPKFWTPYKRDELRAKHGLRAMPTILVMGGGWGLLERDDILSHLLGWADRLQVIICCGSNEKALAKLRQDPRCRHENVRLYGFTDDVDQLMEVSDLLLTKPGGMTCTEGLAKGLPMLFYPPIPGQEEQNMRVFVEHGYGEAIVSTATLDRWFARLVSGDRDLPARPESGQSAVRSRPYASAERIVQLLRALDNERKKAVR